mgnify:CR=1 FL=1
MKENSSIQEIKPLEDISYSRVNSISNISNNNPEKIDKLEKELPKIFPDLYIVKSTPYFLEFSNPEASKKCAVEFLQNYWGLQKR